MPKTTNLIITDRWNNDDFIDYTICYTSYVFYYVIQSYLNYTLFTATLYLQYQHKRIVGKCL